MKVLKSIVLALCVIALLGGIFCGVVGIASAVNGISFSEQILQWFGSVTTQTPEPSLVLNI